jgi:hypothetical protein
MIFKNIPIGTELMFNGHFAVKVKQDQIQIPRLGVDGFFHIGENQNIETLKELEAKNDYPEN